VNLKATRIAKEETATVDAIISFNSKGCLGCHAVDSLD
jgi:cytochrome c551/c552